MLSKIEEIKLIARCVAFDDHRAFAKLVDAYSAGLRRFVFNLTLGDAALTDDIAQETFIKAYTSLRSFKGLARFGTWLFSIACRVHADYVRSHRELPLDPKLQINTATAPDSIAATDAALDAAEALKVLNPAEREAVLLFYLEDLPIKEVSRITGQSEGSVKSNLSRARIKMARFVNTN